MGVPVNYNLRNLVERKGTTLMTAVGIGLTVAILVTATALTSGLKSIFTTSADPAQMLVLRKGVNSELSSTVANETYQIIRRLPGIATTAGGEPMVSPEGVQVVNLPSVDSPEGMNVTIRGLLSVGLSMRTITIEQGEMFHPGLRQIAVGESIARRYPAVQIGKQVRFGRGVWEIVGVFTANDSTANSEIWADLNQLRGDFESAGGSSSLRIRTDSPATVAALSKQIEDDQRLSSSAMSESDYYATMNQSGQPLQALGISVSIIMAIGSAFAATNTMYAAVARRSREIGTLRALGFGRGAILRSFMLESICLALLGGLLGVLLALPFNGLTTGIGNSITFSEIAFKFKITPAAIFRGLLFSVIIGAIGGFPPAWSAARKNIIMTMREG
jgi:putative ABC transport system permease protein